MTRERAFRCPHEHRFLAAHQHRHERRTWAVIGLTAVMMAAEIVSGLVFGSMALLVDGWHMASHASALGITALAYAFSRKHVDNPAFVFGTGKVGDLAGYSSALLLALIALLMAYESAERLVHPVPIRFNEAILVACLGLIVNLGSAVLLREDHEHGHESAAGHHDHNLRAAYLHVLADALTSILAIAALVAGRFRGWSFMDPVMGLVGAAVITRWSWGLMRDTGRTLLDYQGDRGLYRRIRSALEEGGGVRLDDIHVWRVGPGHFSAAVSLTSSGDEAPDHFKDRLCGIPGLSHVTLEVNPRAPKGASRVP
jgi:cation diffusion facilitator family transporter